jgi:putative DNA primase/helicase
LAVQTHYDVERAKSLAGPTGLFLVAIAESGERKSSCDGYFSKALRDHDSEQAEAAKPDIRTYEASRAAWAAEKSGIEAAIKAAAKGGDDTSNFKRQLLAHEALQPLPPIVPRLVYGDATPEALIDGLSAWKSGGVLSAEAGAVLGGHAMGDSAMRNLSTLNMLWSGEAIRQDRRSRPSVNIEGARLTIGLQVQESTLREFIRGTGDLARGTGFFARCLMAWPESTQGTRRFQKPPEFTALGGFTDRLKLILSRPVPADHAKTMLRLSEGAHAAWVTYHNHIETELREGGELRDIRDIASKSADAAARISALFHVFEGKTGVIDAATMGKACELAAWHLNESLRFFGQMSQPKNMSDAARAEEWAVRYLQGTDTDKISTRDLQRLGPVRDKQSLDDALRELADLGRARMLTEGRKKLVQIRPEVLGGAE